MMVDSFTELCLVSISRCLALQAFEAEKGFWATHTHIQRYPKTSKSTYTTFKQNTGWGIVLAYIYNYLLTELPIQIGFDGALRLVQDLLQCLG